MKKRKQSLQNNAEHFEINMIEKLLLKVMYMRGSYECEIVCQGDKATVSKYEIRYVNNEDKRVLQNSVSLPCQQVVDKLNEFEIGAWDGFFGAHPADVSDGVMFDLEAVVNGDKSIHAEGSENFPPHYRELVRWFDELLAKQEENVL